MCVIAVVENVDERPTDDQVNQMYEANKHGGGVGWVDKTLNTVMWRKGLSLEDMRKLNRELPLPYILHFRVPSHGTMTGPFGCHPFPISEDARIDLEGDNEAGVLFHNGMWTSWKHEIKDLATRGHHRVPTGGWTDSRALAWVAHHLGIGYLDFIDEKVAVLLTDNIFLFGRWEIIKVGENGSFFVSNKGWERSTPAHGVPYHAQPIASLGGPSIGVAKSEGTGGSPRQGTFPVTGRSSDGEVSSEGDREEGVEQGAEEAGKGSRKGSQKETQSALILLPGSTGHGLKCCKCGSMKSGDVHEGLKYCWQCWAAFKPERTKRPASKVDTNICDSCYIEVAHCRKCSDDTYICHKCWEKNGNPAIYFGPKTLDDMVRESKRKLHDRGIRPFVG